MGLEGHKFEGAAAPELFRKKEAIDLKEGDFLPDYDSTFVRFDYAGAQQGFLVLENGSKIGPVDRDDEFVVSTKA